MANPLSNTQIDRLGVRLRAGNVGESDIRLLDEFRTAFTNAYQTVIATVRDNFGLSPTGRPAKSTSSIVEKLNRESIRLSQMQDIAGCRAVVADTRAQDDALANVLEAFARTTVFDRRETPSHGYRAVHVVVRIDGKPVEIQIRTQLEHMWAELSEKLSDVVSADVKYGGGSPEIRQMLDGTSEQVLELTALERQLLSLADDIKSLGVWVELKAPELPAKVEAVTAKWKKGRDGLTTFLADSIAELRHALK